MIFPKRYLIFYPERVGPNETTQCSQNPHPYLKSDKRVLESPRRKRSGEAPRKERDKGREGGSKVEMTRIPKIGIYKLELQPNPKILNY